MKRKSITIGAIVAVSSVVIVASLPFLIDANRFKPTLETDLSAALGRDVRVGHLRLAVLSGDLTMDDMSIADDPAFSRSPFLKAKRVTASVSLVPLIVLGKLHVYSLAVTDPHIRLLHTPSGTWNVSTLGAASNPAAARSGPTDTSVPMLKISNGTLEIGMIGAAGKTRTYQDVALDASNLSYSSQFRFSLAARTSAAGTVKVSGHAGPIDRRDTLLTPLNADVDVRNLDLAATGVVNPSAGLAGLIDFTGNVISDGRWMNSKGRVKADRITLAAAGSFSRVPVTIEYQADFDLERRVGSLRQGDVHIGKALARLSGTYETAGLETTVQMRLNGQRMSVSDLEGVLPAVGITLPSEAWLENGFLDADLALTGPVNGLAISGRDLQVSDVTFSVRGKAGVFDLNPVTTRVFGGQAVGSIRVDVSGRVPSYQLHGTLLHFRIEEFLETLSPKKSAEGSMDFSASLSMRGKTAGEMVQTAEGEVSLRGDNLTLGGSDLDRVLSRFESSQSFNLLDVGAFFFAGPFGPLVTKGYNFASIFVDSGDSSKIRTLLSNWRVDRGVAQAKDVAMATARNRIALQGGLDFVNGQFVDVTMAAIDASGCATVRQKIHGPFGKPVVENPAVLPSLAGPVTGIYTNVRGLFPGPRCDIFYTGSVAPSKRKREAVHRHSRRRARGVQL